MVREMKEMRKLGGDFDQHKEKMLQWLCHEGKGQNKEAGKLAKEMEVELRKLRVQVLNRARLAQEAKRYFVEGLNPFQRMVEQLQSIS